MRGDRDDASAHRYRDGGGSVGPASSGLRTAGLAAGSCLAVGATVVVLLTEDPQVLRLAVVAAAWAFVLAALVTSRRTADGAPVDGGELAVERAAALRLAHELELEREVAARREHERGVENDLRRAGEQSMRAELEALRGELAQVGELRRELGQVAELRRDLAGLAELRTTLAGLDLTGLAELRSDVGRLRSELTEQLSGEMLVERVMLRTQSTRTAPAAAEPAAPRTVESDGWNRPASELTAAWPAVRADEPAPGTRRLDEVRVESPRTAASPPPPLDRPAGRSLVDAPPSPYAEPDPRRRRTDAPAPSALPVPDDQLSTERPVAQRQRPPVPAAPTAEAATPAEEDPSTRLAQLLAESGLTPPSGGRRRRRHREDDESDDVLARVLGR